MFYIVEVRDNEDPSGSNRVKCRFINKENNESKIPDEGLRWCHPIYPMTEVTSAGIGTKPPAPPVGARLIAFFLPDDDGQQSPFVLGCVTRSEKDDSEGIQKRDNKTGAKSPEGTKGPDSSVSIA